MKGIKILRLSFIPYWMGETLLPRLEMQRMELASYREKKGVKQD